MPERDAWRTVRRHWRLWLVNLIAGAGLLAAAYGWFWIPDQKFWQLALSALAALTITGACIWLAAASAAALAESKARYGQCAVWLATLSLWVWVVQWLNAGSPRQSAWLASLWAKAVHGQVNPALLTPMLGFIWTAVLWVGFVALVPYLHLSWKESAAALRKRRYWAAALAGVFAGFWLPWQLFQWAPGFEGFNVQVTSLAIRLAIAWTVMVTAWLWLLALAARQTGSTVTSSR